MIDHSECDEYLNAGTNMNHLIAKPVWKRAIAAMCAAQWLPGIIARAVAGSGNRIR